MATIAKTEQLTQTKQSLDIEVPRKDLQTKSEELYHKLQTEADIPGFRRGKAPLELVKLRFMKTVQEQAVQEVVSDAIQEIFKENELRVVGTPKLGEIKNKDGGEDKQQPIRFDLEVEYVPEYELAEYEQMAFKRGKFEITETEVAQALENLREQQTFFEPVQEQQAEKGNSLVLDIKATVNDNELQELTKDGASIILGDTEHLVNLDENLLGAQIGDHVTVDTKIPATFPVEEVREKDCHLEIDVREIKKRVVPELDDELAKDYGQATLAELKDMIRENLRANAADQEKQQNKDLLIERLLTLHQFPVPLSLLEAHYEHIRSLQKAEFLRMGAEDEKMDAMLDELSDSAWKNAARQARQSIILSDIAKKEEMTLSDDEFDKKLGETAVNRGYDPERFASYVFRRELDDYYKNLFLEDKVLEFVVEKVKDYPEPVASECPAAVDSNGETHATTPNPPTPNETEEQQQEMTDEQQQESEDK